MSLALLRRREYGALHFLLQYPPSPARCNLVYLLCVIALLLCVALETPRPFLGESWLHLHWLVCPRGPLRPIALQPSWNSVSLVRSARRAPASRGLPVGLGPRAPSATKAAIETQACGCAPNRQYVDMYRSLATSFDSFR